MSVATFKSNGTSDLPWHDLIDRLVDVSRHLLDLGTPLHAIAPTLFDGLTKADTDDRAGLFRTGLGLSAPLPRGAASDLAAKVERQLRGPKDHTFERQFTLAHLLAAGLIRIPFVQVERLVEQALASVPCDEG